MKILFSFFFILSLLTTSAQTSGGSFSLGENPEINRLGVDSIGNIMLNYFDDRTGAANNRYGTVIVDSVYSPVDSMEYILPRIPRQIFHKSFPARLNTFSSGGVAYGLDSGSYVIKYENGLMSRVSTDSLTYYSWDGYLNAAEDTYFTGVLDSSQVSTTWQSSNNSNSFWLYKVNLSTGKITKLDIPNVPANVERMQILGKYKNYLKFAWRHYDTTFTLGLIGEDFLPLPLTNVPSQITNSVLYPLMFPYDFTLHNGKIQILLPLADIQTPGNQRHVAKVVADSASGNIISNSNFRVPTSADPSASLNVQAHFVREDIFCITGYSGAKGVIQIIDGFNQVQFDTCFHYSPSGNDITTMYSGLMKNDSIFVISGTAFYLGQGFKFATVFFIEYNLSQLISSIGIPERVLELSLYPNPAKSHLILNAEIDSGRYSIFDTHGREIRNGVYAGKGTNIDVKNLPAGNYILKLTEGGYSEGIKFLIRK